MQELIPQDVSWVTRNLPRDLREMLKREGRRLFVAGGFIRSCVAGEKINDIDCFTATKEDAERCAQDLAGPCSKPYASGNAFTVENRNVQVQFIHRWTFAHPHDAMESFDFTIAKAALWWGPDFPEKEDWRSACADTFYADLAAKRLVYTSPQRNEDAGGSFLRVLKFAQRGYRCPVSSLGAVMARLCQGVDWEDHLVHTEAGKAKVLAGLLYEVDPFYVPDLEGPAK